MAPVTALASDPLALGTGDPCLSHRTQGEDRQISRNKLSPQLF